MSKRVTFLGVLSALIFVLFIQVFAVLITLLNAPVYSVTGYSYTPLGTSAAGSAGNALLFVASVFIATIIMLWLVRKKMTLSFKFLIFGAIALSAYFLTLITLDSLLSFLNLGLDTVPLEIIISFTPVIAIAYTTFFNGSKLISTAVLALLSAEVGSFFASTFPPITALLLPVIFSVYDIYAVFKGPLRELVTIAPSNVLTNLSVRVGEFTIGLGDTMFYAMLPSFSAYMLSLECTIFTLSAIDIGFIITLYLLSKRRLLPGLPIPMALGLVTILACYR